MGDIRSMELAAIGTSHGGLAALAAIFKNLSEDFILPVIIAYHRSRKSSWAYLEEYFSGFCRFKIKEVEDLEVIKPGCIYFAPAGYHAIFEDHALMSVILDDYFNYSRPSIDILFDSAVECYKNRLMGILLTGANTDGAKGLCRIAKAGGYTVVQDPSEAVAGVMPQGALDICRPDSVENLNGISRLMNEANACFREKI